MDHGHAVLHTLTPAIILLGLGILAALASIALRLSPIVGYLVLGAGLAAAGFRETFEGPMVDALAEAGVMFLLFNLGLHFSLSRIRAEAGAIFGFGSLQMAVTGGGFALIGWLLGLPPAAAVLCGLALGLSSTAVVIGLLRERDQEDCPVGRAGQAILIFQDIAAILLLVAAGALGGAGPLLPALGVAGLKAVAAFGVAVLFARYLTRPMFALVTRASSGEVYTATALFLALAAGWATGAMGLSLTLGAFLGGVAIAESRYRILIQSELEAFRGLFLGFFFMVVGLSLDIGVLRESWSTVLLVTVALILVKSGLNIVAALVNRWSVPGSIQLGFLLGQGSEFALVLFAVPAVAALLGAETVAILVAAIAASLTVTPAFSELGRRLAGKLRRGPADEKLREDDALVVIFGMSGTGRAVADALEQGGVGYLAVEADRHRFERALADGYRVLFAPLGDPRSWPSLALERRQAVVVSPERMERAHELGPLVAERHPHLDRFIVAEDDADLAQLRQDGSQPFDMSRADGEEALIAALLSSLGVVREERDSVAA